MAASDFPGPPALQQLWQTVTINVIDPLTIEFQLAEPYAPFLQATTRGILPAHRLAGTRGDDLLSHPFSLSPVGTGPFVVPANQEPQRSGRLQLLPYPGSLASGNENN